MNKELLKPNNIEYEALLKAGNKAMQQGCYYEAISKYTEMLQFDDIKRNKYVIPRILACYRRLDLPYEALRFHNEMLIRYGAVIHDSVVLTVLSSVFGDMNMWDNAKGCAKKAAELNGGIVNEYLMRVIERINRNYPIPELA